MDEEEDFKCYISMECTNDNKEFDINKTAVDPTNISCLISTITQSDSDEAFKVILRD